jgi:hypothetical protein
VKSKFDFDLQIGITGHRAICTHDLPVINAEIKNRLLKIQNQYKDKSICLLSGLADGADRLAVAIALELGVPFKAILPMALSDYIADFKTQSSLDEFYDLLKHAVSVEALPSLSPMTDENRDLCYRQLAIHLANNADVLIALWDGDMTEKTGGTSQVVKYFKQVKLNNVVVFEHILIKRV